MGFKKVPKSKRKRGKRGTHHVSPMPGPMPDRGRRMARVPFGGEGALGPAA